MCKTEIWPRPGEVLSLGAEAEASTFPPAAKVLSSAGFTGDEVGGDDGLVEGAAVGPALGDALGDALGEEVFSLFLSSCLLSLSFFFSVCRRYRLVEVGAVEHEYGVAESWGLGSARSASTPIHVRDPKAHSSVTVSLFLSMSVFSWVT